MRDEEKSHSKFENFCQTIKNFVKTEEINLIFDPNSKKARHYSDDEKKSGKKEIPSYLKRKLENNKYPENEKIIYEKPGRKKLRRAWCFNDRGAILPYVASVYYTHYICISRPPRRCRRPAVVIAALRRGDRDGEQHARRALDRLGQRLRERELVIERPARKVVAADEAARVGDPLVDQDHRRGVGTEQLVQRLRRAGCGRRPRSRPSRMPPCRRAARRARPRSC